jgi:hypothetical protein
MAIFHEQIMTRKASATYCCCCSIKTEEYNEMKTKASKQIEEKVFNIAIIFYYYYFSIVDTFVFISAVLFFA